ICPYYRLGPNQQGSAFIGGPGLCLHLWWFLERLSQRPAFAGRVVDRSTRAFGNERFRDGRTDSFARAGDDCDFAGEFSCFHSCHSRVTSFLVEEAQAAKPPSMVRHAPVTNAASGLARYATIPAFSSAWPYRGSAINAFRLSANGPVAGFMSVSTG